MRLEALCADKHAALLFRTYQGHDAVWDYLPYGPFHSAAAYHRGMKGITGGPDPLFYGIYDKDAGLILR